MDILFLALIIFSTLTVGLVAGLVFTFAVVIMPGIAKPTTAALSVPFK